MSELLSFSETRKLLDEMDSDQKKLVDEIIPSQISVTGVQRVLQTLLGERVSIRDLPAILEGIAEASGHTKNSLYITEHVRTRLARQLCHQHLSPGGYLPLVALSPAWEQAFAESIIGQGEERQLAMAPSQLQQFITAVRDRFDEAGQQGEVPVLLTSPQVRPFVRSIVERFRPLTTVMSQNEIHASVKLRTLGQV
jgi:flagellar biosynthesis protein FlhA